MMLLASVAVLIATVALAVSTDSLGVSSTDPLTLPGVSDVSMPNLPSFPSMGDGFPSLVSNVAPSTTTEPFGTDPLWNLNSDDQTGKLFSSTRTVQLKQMVDLENAIQQKQNMISAGDIWLQGKKAEIKNWLDDQTHRAQMSIGAAEEKMMAAKADVDHLGKLHSQLAKSINDMDIELKRRSTMMDLEMKKRQLDTVDQVGLDMKTDLARNMDSRNDLESEMKQAMDALTKTNFNPTNPYDNILGGNTDPAAGAAAVAAAGNASPSV